MAAVLRLFHLGHQSLWIDEIFTWYSADVGRPLALQSVIENVHGPLHSLAVHLSANAFGDREWALRLPSALAGIALVPAMAWLADRWVGRAAVAWAAWLTALSPFFVWYSQETRNYAFLLLFSTLASAALLEARERPAPGAIARGLAASAAAALSNLSFALLLPVYAWWWFSPGGDRRGRVRLAAVAALLLALVALPWVPQIARTWDWARLAPVREARQGETPLRGSTTFHPGALPFTLHTFAVGYTLGPSLRELKASPLATVKQHAVELAAVALGWGALLAMGLVGLARRGRLPETLVWCVAPFVAVSYFAMQNFKVFNPRYVAVTAPCLLLVAVVGLVDVRRAWRWLLASVVIALSVVSLAHLYFDPSYAREDYRGAMTVLREHRRPGERVIAAGAVDAVEYYARDVAPVQRWWLGWTEDPARMRSKLDEALSGTPGAWVIVSRPEDLDPEDRFAKLLDERTPPAERWTRPGVRIWHVRGTP